MSSHLIVLPDGLKDIDCGDSVLGTIALFSLNKTTYKNLFQNLKAHILSINNLGALRIFSLSRRCPECVLSSSKKYIFTYYKMKVNR